MMPMLLLDRFHLIFQPEFKFFEFYFFQFFFFGKVTLLEEIFEAL